MREATTEYIFSINTGRAGSNYLANIFDHVSGCRSFHEPDPMCNGEAMQRYGRGHTEPMRELAEQKVRAIRELKGDSRVYVETNHCFIKGFGWFVPQHLPDDRIGVVILKREKSKVAESLLRIGCSPLDARGRVWVSTPEMKAPLVKPPKRGGSPRATYLFARGTKVLLRRTGVLKSDATGRGIYPRWLLDYEMDCLKWYVEETDARAELFRQTYPRIRYYETSVEELNSIESVRQMLAHFGLSEKESLTSVVGQPTNLKRIETAVSDQPVLTCRG